MFSSVVWLFKRDHTPQGCNGELDLYTNRQSLQRGLSWGGRTWRSMRGRIGTWQGHGQGSSFWCSWAVPALCHFTSISSSQQPYKIGVVSIPISQMRTLKLITLSAFPKTVTPGWPHMPSLCSTDAMVPCSTRTTVIHVLISSNSCDSFSNTPQSTSQIPSYVSDDLRQNYLLPCVYSHRTL